MLASNHRKDHIHCAAAHVSSFTCLNTRNKALLRPKAAEIFRMQRRENRDQISLEDFFLLFAEKLSRPCLQSCQRLDARRL